MSDDVDGAAAPKPAGKRARETTPEIEEAWRKAEQTNRTPKSPDRDPFWHGQRKKSDF